MTNQKLVDLLNDTHPLSQGFKEALALRLKRKTVKPKTNLLSIGDYSTSIYYLVSGYAKARSYDQQGNEMVQCLYRPNQVFTEVHSFFEGVPSKISIAAISACEVLLLHKNDHVLFNEFKEMARLNEKLILREKKMAEYRNYLLRFAAPLKVKLFFNHYPGHHLPGKDCASFLQMTESNYSAAKARYNKNGGAV